MSKSMNDLLLFGSYGSSYGAASDPSGMVPMPPRTGETALRAVGTAPVLGDGNDVDGFPSSPTTTATANTTIKRTGSLSISTLPVSPVKRLERVGEGPELKFQLSPVSPLSPSSLASPVAVSRW